MAPTTLESVKKGILDFLRLVMMFHHSSSSKNKLWRVPGVYGAFQELEFKSASQRGGGEQNRYTITKRGSTD